MIRYHLVDLAVLVAFALRMADQDDQSWFAHPDFGSLGSSRDSYVLSKMEMLCERNEAFAPISIDNACFTSLASELKVDVSNR